MLKVLCRSLLLGLLWLGQAQATSVVFLNPGHAAEPFWASYSQFMQDAAQSLGMQLTVRYSEREPGLALQQAREVLQGPLRPDYLVLVNEQYMAPEIIRLSQGSGVRLFLVNNGLTADQARLIEGHPERYPPLVGTLVGNDEEAGYRQMVELIGSLPPAERAADVEVLAFAGLKVTPASQLREQGMRRALVEHPNVRLRQVVYGGWLRERAYEQARLLALRYPKVRLVWAANDEMAFGAMQAFAALGRRPGKDVLFGAINTSPQALQARVDGRLSVLLGGHFAVGGWAMVMLHDHALGLPMDREGMLPVFQLIDPQRARRWLAQTHRDGYHLDFTRFSAEGKGTGFQYPFMKGPMEF